MRILINHRVDWRKDQPVETYSRSFIREFVNLGHEVTCVGCGHNYRILEDFTESDLREFDLYLSIDSGRNTKGELSFQAPPKKIFKESAMYSVDAHGFPTEHKRLSTRFRHVFFAVFAKRDLFVNHASAHWLPSASDVRWFDKSIIDPEGSISPDFQFGFFGSKGGIHRADILVDICKEHKWSCDVREVSKPFRHKWPQTGLAMATCKNLFNRGQKHDSPNLRVIESMLMKVPLLSNYDSTDGMELLFEDGKHFLAYSDDTHLGELMRLLIEYPDLGKEIADAAYKEVLNKHLVKHRVKQILEVVS